MIGSAIVLAIAVVLPFDFFKLKPNSNSKERVDESAKYRTVNWQWTFAIMMFVLLIWLVSRIDLKKIENIDVAVAPLFCEYDENAPLILGAAAVTLFLLPILYSINLYIKRSYSLHAIANVIAAAIFASTFAYILVQKA